MKKTLRSILTLALAAALVLSSLSVCFAVEGEKPYTVLMLGDSTNVGYATKAYSSELSVNGTQTPGESVGFNCISRGSIPDLLTPYLESAHPGYKMYQYGVAAPRVCDIRFFLDNDYSSDGYFDWYFTDWYFESMITVTDKAGENLSTEEQVSYFRQKYQSATKEADLIVIELGCNDTLSWPDFAVSDREISDMEDYLAQLRYGVRVCEIRNELMRRLKGLLPSDDFDLLPEIYKKTIEAYIMGYIDATVGMDQLIACISDMNPNAKIVVTGINNVAGNTALRLSDEFVFPYGKLNSVLCEMVNAYRRSISPYACKYYFADIDAYDVRMIKEELLDPAADYTDDADCLMRYALNTLGVDLNKVSFEDAVLRMQALLKYANIADPRMRGPQGTFLADPRTMEYIETGCDMTDEEWRRSSEVVSELCYNSKALGCHPSAAGYQAKLPAYIKAIKAAEEKPALVFNFSSTFNKLTDISFGILKKKIEVKNTIRNNIIFPNLKTLVPKFAIPLGR